jgi:hypothetical protein
MLAIILFYSLQSKSQTLIYTYVANILALMISALISFLHGQLTQNDTVFVLVAVGSPASLYIWVKSVVEFWRLLRQWEISLEALRKFSLHGIVVSTLSIWLTMIVLVLSLLVTNSRFSQPACTTVFDLSTWLSLMWGLVYLTQVAFVAMAMDICLRSSAASKERCGILNYSRHCFSLVDLLLLFHSQQI